MLTTVPPRISVLVVICPGSFAFWRWFLLVCLESGESSYGVDDLVDGGYDLVLERVGERKGYTLRSHTADRRVE
jgi:hypothetical protein